jgi:hypothetical protein
MGRKADPGIVAARDCAARWRLQGSSLTNRHELDRLERILQTADSPSRFARLDLALLLFAFVPAISCSILALSGCSTRPVKGAVWIPPASGSDEAQSVTSTVGLAGLFENDLEVVQLYLDLARRHDELVDSVENRLLEQAHYS